MLFLATCTLILFVPTQFANSVYALLRSIVAVSFNTRCQERFIKLEPIPDARVAICMLAPTDPRGLRSIVALRDYAVGDTLFVNETTHIADTVNVTYAFPAVHADFIASIVGASIF